MANIVNSNNELNKLWLSKATLDLSALSKIIGKFWSNMVNFNYSSGRSAGRFHADYNATAWPQLII